MTDLFAAWLSAWLNDSCGNGLVPDAHLDPRTKHGHLRKVSSELLFKKRVFDASFVFLSLSHRGGVEVAYRKWIKFAKFFFWENDNKERERESVCVQNAWWWLLSGYRRQFRSQNWDVGLWYAARETRQIHLADIHACSLGTFRPVGSIELFFITILFYCLRRLEGLLFSFSVQS